MEKKNVYIQHRIDIMLRDQNGDGTLIYRLARLLHPLKENLFIGISMLKQ
jgi:hypothetical protein